MVTAERAWRPFSPKTSTKRSEKPLMTAGESRKPGPPGSRVPANPVSLSHAIRDGKGSFEEAGGPRAYFGFPAQASAEEGRATIETLGLILEEAVQAELGSSGGQAT